MVVQVSLSESWQEDAQHRMGRDCASSKKQDAMKFSRVLCESRIETGAG